MILYIYEFDYFLRAHLHRRRMQLVNSEVLWIRCSKMEDSLWFHVTFKMVLTGSITRQHTWISISEPVASILRPDTAECLLVLITI